MTQKVAILFGLIVSATCMVLHQTPLPLYLPIEYQDQIPNYNFAYDLNAGDFKSQQDNHRGDTVLGQYSLLHPDGVPRTVDYRANEHAGFNTLVNNERRQNNVATDRQVVNENNEARRLNNGGAQAGQPWSTPNNQHPSEIPVTITQTSLYHQSYSHGHKSRV